MFAGADNAFNYTLNGSSFTLVLVSERSKLALSVDKVRFTAVFVVVAGKNGKVAKSGRCRGT